MKILSLISLQFLLTTVVISQWTLETTLPYQQQPWILQICVIDSSVSWVLGGVDINPNPYFPYFALRTKSGWRQITNTDLNTNVNAFVFTAVDSSKVWLGTFWPEEIYFTSNGGINWVLQCHISDTANVRGIKFSSKNPEIGYAFADIGHSGTYYGVHILKTSNSGLNWVRWEFEFPFYYGATNSLAVKDSDYAWFGLGCLSFGLSKIIMTSTGGANWNIYDVEGGFAGVNTLQFSSNGLTGLYVSADVNLSQIYRTTNSGLNWSPIYSMGYYYYSRSMKWVSETSNIYTNDYSSVLRSIDNGLNWSFMTGVNSTHIASLDAVKINASSVYALAVTSEGEVYKLLDTARIIGIEKMGTFIPKEYLLYQNYPNPFNPNTTIKFDLPADGVVTIEIYDILGRKVDMLAKNEFRKAGSYQVMWDAPKFSSGVYFYRFEAGSYVKSKKMVLVK
ncbi:MAG TPA: T9SS type A sorting domain-containing protein [Ignavibacteria bacterium]|nr:T9SS type A sorting domain-containing protein [Ignavibacteria bacterium]